MSNAKKQILLAIFFPVLLFGLVGQAKAATYCFCYDDTEKINEQNFKTADANIQSTQILYCEKDLTQFPTTPSCGDIKKTDKATKYDACLPFDNSTACKDQFTIWQAKKKAKLEAGTSLEKTTTGLVGSIIPSCLLTPNPGSSCDDVGIFVVAGMNLASFLFGIVGALALLMFVYGGFVLILSQGNPEKVKQGTGVMVAAVIGLIIAFGGYLLVKFLGDVVGVQKSLKLN